MGSPGRCQYYTLSKNGESETEWEYMDSHDTRNTPLFF